MDYVRDLKIEPDSLDVEFIRHANKYMKYAELAANADDEVKRCKEALEVIDATIDKEIRATREKVTDSLLKAEIALDQRHQEMLKKLNDANHKSNLYSAAVKAFDHRKSALENLVRLWAGSYFAGPKNPRDLKNEVDLSDKEYENFRNKERVRTGRRTIDN